MEPDLKKMMGQSWSEVKLPENIDDKELRRSRKQIRKKLGFIDGPDFEKPNRLPSAGMFLFGSYPESDILSISTCAGCSRRYKTEWLHNRHWQKNSDGDYVCTLTRKVVIPYHRSSSSSKGDVHNSSSSSTNDHHHHHKSHHHHHHKHHRHHHHNSSSSSSSKKSHSSSNHKLKSEKVSSSSSKSSSSSIKKSSSSSSSSSSKPKIHSSSSSSGKPYSMNALQQKSHHSSSTTSTTKLNTLTNNTTNNNTNNNITISTDSTTNSNSYIKPNSVPIVSIRLKTGGLLQAHHGKPMSQLQQQQQQMISSSTNKALIQNSDKTNAVSYTLSIISQDNGQNVEIDENNSNNNFGNKPVQTIGSTTKKTSNNDHVGSDANQLEYEQIQFYSDTYSEKDKTKSIYPGPVNNSHNSNDNNNYGSPMLSPDVTAGVTLHQGSNSSSLNSFKISIKPKSDNTNTGKISSSLSSKGGSQLISGGGGGGGGELSHALKNKSNNNSNNNNKISSKSSSSHHEMIKHSSLHSGGQSGQNSNNLNVNLLTSSANNNNNNNNNGHFGNLGTTNISSVSNQSSSSSSNNNNKSSIGSPPVFTILAEGNQESVSPPKKKKKKKNEPRKIVPLKERLFDPDLHCGVENTETGERCTRSLTCKAHSMAARRSVPGRTLPFDQLIADHKKARDAEKAAKVAMDLQVQIGNSPGTIKVNVLSNSPSGSTSSNNSNSSRPSSATLGATTTTSNSTYLTTALSKPGLMQRVPSSPLIKITGQDSKDDSSNNKIPVSALVNSLQSSPLSKTLYSLDGNKLSSSSNNNNSSSSMKTPEATSKIQQQQQLAASKVSRTPKDKMKTLSSLLSSSPLGSPVSSPISHTQFKSNNIRSLSTESSHPPKNKAEFTKFKDSKENLLDTMSPLMSPPSDDPLFPRGSPGYSTTMTIYAETKPSPLFSSNSNSEFSLQAADDSSSYQVLATGFQASPSPLNIASPSSSYKPLVNTNNNNINSQYDGSTTKITTPSSSLQTPGTISSYLVRPTTTATTTTPLTRPPVQQGGGSFGYQSVNSNTISSPYQQYPIRYPSSSSSSQPSNIVAENTLYSTIHQEIVSDPFAKPLIPNPISKFNSNNTNLITMNGIDDNSISSLAASISNAKLPIMRGKNKAKKIQKIVSMVEKVCQMESPPPVTLSSVLNTSDAPLICLIPPPNKSIMKRNNNTSTINKRKWDEMETATSTTTDLVDLSIKRRKFEGPLFSSSDSNKTNSISTKFQSEINKNYHSKVNSPVIPFSIQIHESSPRNDFSAQSNYATFASILQSSAQTLYKNASKPKGNVDRALSNFFVSEHEAVDTRNKMNQFTMSSLSPKDMTHKTNNMTTSSENGEVYGLDYSNYRSLSDVYEKNSMNKCGGLGNLSCLDVHKNSDGNCEKNSLNNFDGYNFTGLSGIETFLALIPISET